jgi:hypothetical protein
MPVSRWLKLVWMGLVLLVITPALAKDSKPVMPTYILTARTVAVMIDPDAGVSLKDPNANQTAQKDVETALLKWGRFTTVMAAEGADLVIVLRKGHDKLADTTVSDPRQNSRPGSVARTDDSISIGAQHGALPPPSTPHPEVEVGTTDDSFVVFPGQREDATGAPPGSPTDNVAGWRSVHKNALHSHDVPAVDEFRKAIEEAEKQAAQQKGKHP